MKSNYKRLGNYIREVNTRNRDMAVTKLVGLSITKEFIPSVANIIGTDLSIYKVIRKEQFACSLMQVSRDEKIPIAMLEFDEAIMSPAYPMFEVVDKNKLLPQYLMMWFSRSEFDREASFYAVGGVRGSLTWEDFCNMTLPIPSIEKQMEIVAEYETLTRRITLNQQLCAKLEETEKAIYKKLFVNDIDVENLPDGWRMGNLLDLVEVIDGDRGSNYPNGNDFQDEGYCLFLNAGNVTKNGFNFTQNSFILEQKDKILKKGKLKRFDIVFTTRGTVGNSAFYNKYIPFDNIRINSGMVIMRNTDKRIIPFVYIMLRTFDVKKQIENYLSGSAQPQLPIKDMTQIPIIIPKKSIILSISEKISTMLCQVDILNVENDKLKELLTLLLAKMGVH
jgi:type I restriction enzyme, S subunit